MNRLKALLLCATILSFSLAAASAAAPGGTDTKKGRPAAGRAVYLNNCARCHAPDGTGSTTMGRMTEAPDLSDPAIQKALTTSRMTASVTNGRGQMPSFKKKLSRQEIAAAVAYVRTLKR